MTIAEDVCEELNSYIQYEYMVDAWIDMRRALESSDGYDVGFGFNAKLVDTFPNRVETGFELSQLYLIEVKSSSESFFVGAILEIDSWDYANWEMFEYPKFYPVEKKKLLPKCLKLIHILDKNNLEKTKILKNESKGKILCHEHLRT